MSTPGIPVESDFRTRAKTNDVPVARLIGFEVEEIAQGRATVTLSAGVSHLLGLIKIIVREIEHEHVVFAARFQEIPPA
jgi:hypothetical protein